ncbi:MAG TPA: hypothetical protein VKB86_19555, partial [Pyrinomonadaceae bacterium]|nr:hypothetical protein [Pyrinomonadaceae bacterium]
SQPDQTTGSTNYPNGNVGIGTTTPSSKLDVVPAGDSFTDGVKVRRAGSSTQYGVFNYAYGALMLTAIDTGYQVTSNYGHTFYFNQYDGTTNRTAMFIDGSGNVGIGTTNPSSYRLNLAGDNSSSYPILRLQNTQANGHSWWLYSGAFGVQDALGIYDETAGSYRMFFDGGGKVGIGTSNPSNHLTVQGGTNAFPSTSGSNGADTFLRITNSVGGPTGGALDFGQNGMSGSWLQSRNAGDYTSNFPLLLNPNGGNIGIGKSNPTAKLDVNGDTQVTGNISVTGTNAGNITATGTITGGIIQATYQDVAEWVPSTHALSAGTVVILNPTKTNEVMASTIAYDTRVAGVVSERPGLALGEAGKDKSLVATTGRVKVMVDASKSPIHVGDLLVTSDEEGVAMKSEPVDVGGVKLHRPGTLIGKALEPLEGGKGKILVLLSLQ